MPLLSRSILMIGLLTGVVSVGIADPYTFTTIDHPLAARGTIFTGINNVGQIVGYYIDASASYHGFLYSGGTFTTIDDPLGANTSAFGTLATGINDAGQVVGIVGIYQNARLVFHGFLYSGGTFTTIDDPSGADTYATGINNSGQVVGSYDDGSGISPMSHGFLYKAGTFTDFEGGVPMGINNVGQIVGSGGFLYSNGMFTTISDPLGMPTSVNAINDSGQIVGFYESGGGPGSYHGFLYNSGTFTPIDDPLAGHGPTAAYGINNAGQIVGYYIVDCFSCGFGPHGFIATPSASITISAVVNVDTDLNSATPPPATFNIDSEGAMHVAILGSTSYDVTTIDPATVKFGPKGAPNVGTPFFQDVNADGKSDLILSFVPVTAGFGCYDTTATITGQTYSKQSFSGSEAIQTTHTLVAPLGVCPQ